MSFSTQVRFVVLALTGLMLGTLSGCDSDPIGSYPAAMTYPLRTDLVVKQTPAFEPKRTDRPGELSQLLSLYLPADEFKKSVEDPNNLNAQQRSSLETLLNKLFGTPANPIVGGITDDIRDKLGLQPETLQMGGRLYRQHCLHCHGLTGDGRGPTAPWVNPHPRDYRRGVFKFTSSALPTGKRRAHRDDLLRVLREGIDDSSMPSFRLLNDADLEAIVSYVIHLSLRGQLELEGIKLLASNSMTVSELEEDLHGVFVKNWVDTQDRATLINTGGYQMPDRASAEYRKSVERGMAQFLAKGAETKPGAPASAAAGCVSCHTDFGRNSTYRFDDWGTIVKPADLTRGAYRGGRRPIDLFWRISAGINGVGMPAFAKEKPDAKDGLSSQDIWDIVSFLQVLPYPELHRDFGIEIDTTVRAKKSQ